MPPGAAVAVFNRQESLEMIDLGEESNNNTSGMRQSGRILQMQSFVTDNAERNQRMNLNSSQRIQILSSQGNRAPSQAPATPVPNDYNGTATARTNQNLLSHRPYTGNNDENANAAAVLRTTVELRGDLGMTHTLFRKFQAFRNFR